MYGLKLVWSESWIPQCMVTKIYVYYVTIYEWLDSRPIIGEAREYLSNGWESLVWFGCYTYTNEFKSSFDS